jgi:hypothetical protein
MGILDALFHSLGFMLPALFMALVLPLTGRFFKQKRPLPGKYAAQSAIIFIVCLLVLIAGLLITGRDGKMLSYAAMVLAAASTQWILMGGWRK